MLCSELSSGERVKEMGSAGPVCLCVYSSILAPGARTTVLIGTGEYLFNAPERRKDNGANCRAIGARWHVPHAIAQTLAKNPLTAADQTK